MRSARRRELLKLLKKGAASSQLELAEALRAAGHEATQATISRDLQELGAVKVRVNGHVVYRLADETPQSEGGDLLARALTSTLADFALDIMAAASLVVVKTAPGHASAVARAIDLAGIPGVAGTVAGDDTILVATESAAAAKSLTHRWSSEREV